MTLSIQLRDILCDTALGPVQSAGAMQVIPLLGDDDAFLAPPAVEVGTRTYGTVELRNHADRPTLVPHGAGWVVPQKAQDHALAGGVIVGAAEHKVVTTAMCIQSGQPGTIEVERHRLTMLPAELRVKALATRAVESYSRLWQDIAAFNATFGIGAISHLEHFLRHFSRELGAFVAEFEVVPRQVGAVVLVAGAIVGVERAPSSAYWQLVWEPLVRGCYGSVALRAASASRWAPARAPLVLEERSLAGLRRALDAATATEMARAEAQVDDAAGKTLDAEPGADAELGPVVLTTVAGADLSGQVATVEGRVRFASLCAAA
jgi:hypothetical protein